MSSPVTVIVKPSFFWEEIEVKKEEFSELKRHNFEWDSNLKTASQIGLRYHRCTSCWRINGYKNEMM